MNSRMNYTSLVTYWKPQKPVKIDSEAAKQLISKEKVTRKYAANL